MGEKKVIIISGPTAVGKTDRAIELALQHKTKIISADSRQCYKELNIGVAKPKQADLHKVEHYFINSHSIAEEVNVASFEKYALNAAEEIFETNDVAVMVGGTGLYIKAFAEGLDEIPSVDQRIEQQLRKTFDEKGMEWLQSEIKKNDPLFSEKGEINNPQRTLRALVVKLSTGKSILEFHTGKKVERPFKIEYELMELPRHELYRRINDRVDNMMEAGLLEEAKQLYPFRHLNALQTVGYKELFHYMDGKCTLEEAVIEIKKNTRHYAKRQITWFKKFL